MVQIILIVAPIVTLIFYMLTMYIFLLVNECCNKKKKIELIKMESIGIEMEP